MTEAVIGLDTSNYRTSLAVATREGKILLNRRELLPVPMGERGLRQSDAVYAHLKQLKGLLPELETLRQECAYAAVCASTRPRDRADSYMPVFEAGETVGRGIAAAMGIPFLATDHQHGHIRAAQRGTPMEGKSAFLAMHLSGGTTDLMAVTDGQITELGTSLDLHAGQMVDRVGVAMGMSFPAGPEMEAIAIRGHSEGKLGCAMAEGDLSCHLSGAESQAQRWIAAGTMNREDIAREIYDLMARTFCRMLTAGAKKTGMKEALICGGIAASALFQEMLRERLRRTRTAPRVYFGAPENSGDNAVGVAMIGMDRIRGMA